MLQRFFATSDDRVLLAQRLVLGLVMFAHGAQKLFGWFGGHGFGGTFHFFTDTMHLPAALAVLVILAEGLGSIGLLLGLGTRLAALGIAAVMVGAVVTTHLHNGFFMNWGGAAGGEGFEYHLLALALALPLVWRGAGALSVDRAIAGQLDHRHPALASPSHA